MKSRSNSNSSTSKDRKAEPSAGSLVSREALLNYALDYPPTAQEVEARLLTECDSISGEDEQVSRRRRSSRLSDHDVQRLCHHMILSHSRESLLFKLQKRPELKERYVRAFDNIRQLRMSGFPNFISDRRVSLVRSRRHDAKPKDHRSNHRRMSVSEPAMRMRGMYARQVRRYVSEFATENLTANDKRKGVFVSATAINGDWELELIEGLLFDDLDLEPQPVTTSTSTTPAKSPTTVQTPHKELNVEKIPVKQVLKTVNVVPEVDYEYIESPKALLEIQQLSMPPTLKIVQAVALTEEVIDEISPISDLGTSRFTNSEPISPISTKSAHDEPESPTRGTQDETMSSLVKPVPDEAVAPASSETMRLITFEDVHEIKLDAENWPLPKAESEPGSEPESETEPPYQYTAASRSANPEPKPESLRSYESQQSIPPTSNAHPHPLRSNPTHLPKLPTVPKSRSPSPAHLPRPSNITRSRSPSPLARPPITPQSTHRKKRLASPSTQTPTSPSSSPPLTPPSTSPPPPPTLRNKQSTSSLQSNRKAVIIGSSGKNNSSLSLHSQGTITDMDMNTSWLQPPAASKHSIRDNRRFSGILNLKRAGAVRHGHRVPLATMNSNTSQSQSQNSLPRSRNLNLKNTSLALLTPVSETFES